MFDSFVFLPLSTRAYFKGRAYIKIILKNHARSYFAGRSYYRGNTVAAFIFGYLFVLKSECLILFALDSHTRWKQRPIYLQFPGLHFVTKGRMEDTWNLQYIFSCVSI